MAEPRALADRLGKHDAQSVKLKEVVQRTLELPTGLGRHPVRATATDSSPTVARHAKGAPMRAHCGFECIGR